MFVRLQIGSYTLIRKLGRAVSASCWRNAALNSLPPTSPSNFRTTTGGHEAIKQKRKLWEKRRHPNFDDIDADEYDGKSSSSRYHPTVLWRMVKTKRAMPVTTGDGTTIQILAVEFLTRALIHRDLKTANILLQGTTPRLRFRISRDLRPPCQPKPKISGTSPICRTKRWTQTLRPKGFWSVGVNLYRFWPERVLSAQEVGFISRVLCASWTLPIRFAS